MNQESIKNFNFEIKTKRCKCKNVLIVDSDGCNLSVLQRQLKNIDLEINTTVAFYGEHAIEIFKEKIKSNDCKFCDFFNFILMELKLPDTNGAKLTEEI